MGLGLPPRRDVGWGAFHGYGDEALSVGILLGNGCSFCRVMLVTARAGTRGNSVSRLVWDAECSVFRIKLGVGVAGEGDQVLAVPCFWETIGGGL